MISVVRDKQKHAKSVNRTSRGWARSQDGCSAAALARHSATRFSSASENRSDGQADRADPLKPRDLREQRLKTRRAGI